MITRLTAYSAQIASLVFIVIVWAIASAVVNMSALPSPFAVFGTLADLVASGRAFEPLGNTLGRTILGFVLAILLGTTYGIAAALSRTFAELTRWLLQIAIFTPTLILIFLFLISLGRSNGTIILLIGLVVMPVVGTYIRDAMGDFDDDLSGMARSYHVGLWQRVTGMYLPFLIPPLLAAGRIGFTLSWKVAFLSEIFGFPNGIGWQVKTSYDIYNIQTLLAWLMLFIIVLLVVEQLMRLAERTFVKW
ncbi:hypothetical protein DLJ53_25600 [Acuticoccus sediminis]|uniref:ABC transmembrane type-1 domain-containing protein n=1 Tax=Acuticoccus sediminis TaxID=2184697 RepID=A0A8B2NMH2_9HYPH|nr:ABC transporter permease subunit [Acuticoccus sediminis]RAH99004.1 hypothetical protein DLJ53_25600 [Acuticoccus sediminis]